jgi:uncharacterized protein YbbC (DUF1343 family)
MENNFLAGKTVAVVCNHTARVGASHLVDTLVRSGVRVREIYAPEHGFRGEAEAGAIVQDGRDARTGIPVVSLYGQRHGPAPEELSGLDAVVFDIQDVGARFYTYISTLTHVMNACAAAGVELVVLDRPNPNGFYVDGPTMTDKFKSFVGMHNVPIVHGMTVGEYASMVNGERWLPAGRPVGLRVVAAENYRHAMRWADTGMEWMAPSPNLPTPESAYWYPLLCWYEGTKVSVGRGTSTPFSVVGLPNVPVFPDTAFAGMRLQSHEFIPRSMPGKAAAPVHQDRLCRGYRLLPRADDGPLFVGALELLILLYRTHPESFFNAFFDKLAGSEQLRNDVVAGKSARQIWQSWQNEVEKFKVLRSRYLLYP